jgi:DNA-3-methyladenine glycosylase
MANSSTRLLENYLQNKALPLEFFLRPTSIVARNLLGKGLYVVKEGKPTLIQLIEVEVYLGSRDPASHAYRGLTERNWPMFEAGGTCYVYLSYGLNYCMNVATREKGCGEAILFRAALPLFGHEVMRQRRGPKVSEPNLLNGPGKLCHALGIDLSYNGMRFDRDDFKLVDLGHKASSRLIGKSPRIGITKAADKLLRFYFRSSPGLSRKG